MDFKLSRYHHLAADEDTIPNKKILFSTRSGIALELDNTIIDNINSENWAGIETDLLAQLINFEVIVPREQDELDHLLGFNIENTKDIDSKGLTFIIQPSANCQLGCHYCGQSHVKDVIDKNTGDLIYARILDKINALPSLKNLNITWYGGEPLTALSGIKYLSKKLIALAKERKLSYTSDMITNGLALKPAIFEQLVSEHLITHYQITIDGTEEFHNKRRFLKNKNESFKYIYNNVKEIVNSSFYSNSGANILIRSNIDAENKDNIYELLEMMQNDGILQKVKFDVEQIHDWGDNKATQVNVLTKEEYAQFEIDLYIELMNYKNIENLNILPKRKTFACMVISETAEVVDAYGNVATCWEVPYTPAYENTPYYSGNLHDNANLSTKEAPMRNWYKEIPTNDSWCKSCKFLPVCGGSCPKNWYDNIPACPSFKFNIDERLFLKKYLSEQ